MLDIHPLIIKEYIFPHLNLYETIILSITCKFIRECFGALPNDVWKRIVLNTERCARVYVHVVHSMYAILCMVCVVCEYVGTHERGCLRECVVY